MTGQPEKFDAIVIGTGQGGKPLAGEFAKAEWKTAIIERDRVGGSCVVSGCTPTKTMVASARVAHLARRAADYGVEVGEIRVDQKVVRERKRAIVDMFSNGSRREIEKWKTMDLIMGEGAFSGPSEITIELNDGGKKVITSDKIFLNVGARPSIPPIAGLDEVSYLDSTSIMELDEVPRHLVIMGGGYIGLEFGQMFRRFGAQVTIIDSLDTLLPREDPEFGEAVAAILSEDGLKLHLGTTVTEVSEDDDGLKVLVDGPGGTSTIVGTHLLVAAGRRSNADRLNLDVTEIEVDARGFISVNNKLETSQSGVWALGDVTGGPAFTHISYDDYRIIAENVLRDGDCNTDGRQVPYVAYMDPQYGRVGLNETEARERGIDVRVASLPMSHVARALEVDETRGLLKVVVAADSDQILGCAVLGIEGGEIMSMIQIAMMGETPFTKLRHGIFAHPTFAEAFNNLFAKLS
jgi:pyruvate/2-oxoglutarate dehydrogenase complex dihydrolipoamide dehydrogenase (E3) component